MRVIVTGGGTGGHIYPALAIADKIMELHPESEVLYIGTPNSLEERIVAKHGYNFASVVVKGFQRKISFENIKRLFIANYAIKKADKIIKEFKPDVVIGTGGYVSGPVVYAAKKNKVLSVIHEQNAFPGITNRILSKKIDKIFLGFEVARNKFRTKADIRTVGNPVRNQMLNPLSREEARNYLRIEKDAPFVLVSGGSSGSDSINEAFMEMIPELVQKEIGFVFSTGKRHYDVIMEKAGSLTQENKYMIVEYIEDMSNYIAASDICIISAGAMTIAEINAVGRASVIVPKAYSAENHQEINAKNIQNNGAGYYIKENQLDSLKLKGLTYEILFNKDLKDKMEKSSKGLYNINPCETIVSDIDKLLMIK